ncbi:MAG: DNA repair protein RadA [Candidatus Obscuribacterales bacterium]|nr:DNA repair protein RadA [Candidatus Obscuribacterales bacterium]
MAKSKSRWVCQECGFASSGFLGRCTDCGAWSSLVEEITAESTGKGRPKEAPPAESKPIVLDFVEPTDEARFASGLKQVDEVLGGGVVTGSVILLAGDPGIGKSTMLLQMARLMAKRGRVLYVSAEESAQQVRLRAARIGRTFQGDETVDVLITSEQNLDSIERYIIESKPDLVVIDSIQSIYHPDISSAPGSVGQVRECAGVLQVLAKSRGISMIIVGHVTKDGSIAGPRVLEHIVDVVLQFEGERHGQLRILRAVKNRFGSTAEVAIFSMKEEGLKEVDNPSAIFLADRLKRLGHKQAASGTAIVATGEGSRTLLLEVQALVGTSAYPSPRRVANGFDLSRVLQILAVLEKKASLSLAREDVYVNVVGGFEFSDPAGDLGVALAVATSSLDRSVDPGLVVIGELGLSGEVRPVAAIDRRLKECQRMGFTKAIVSAGNELSGFKKGSLEVIGVEYLSEALEAAMPGFKTARRKSYPREDMSPESKGVPADKAVSPVSDV